MSSPNAEALSSTLDQIVNNIQERVILQSEHDPNAIALWTAGSYLMDHWPRFPKLLIVSPERECGKTTALQTIEPFVFKGLLASSITASALYRYIEKEKPTLLIDEADRFLKNNEELKAVINAGHSKRGANKIISVPTKSGDWEPKKMSLWGAQAIAGIGEFDNTLESRSIKIGLRRKGENENVTEIDDTYFDAQSTMRGWLASWSSNVAKQNLLIEPIMPSEIGNRRRDNWKPLFQIAQLAGEEWIKKGFAALEELELKRKSNTAVSQSNELLADLRHILSDYTGPEISSSELLKKLLRQNESEWDRANHGRAITSKWLLKQLRPYGITAHRRNQFNAYMLADLQDAFDRYLPPLP